jgi:hypothetical protein
MIETDYGVVTGNPASKSGGGFGGFDTNTLSVAGAAVMHEPEMTEAGGEQEAP